MGFITGIEELTKIVEQSSTSEKQKVKWLSLNDGQSIKIRFVSELSDESPGYDEHRGTAYVESEHQNPDDYRSKAACSMEEEGRCWACEQVQATGNKKWYPKRRVYFNVLVDDGVEEPHVVVWSMAVRRNPVWDMIVEYFQETGAISNMTWKLKRNGKGTDTTYLLIPNAPDAKPFEWPELELFDLSNVVYHVAYEKQAGWFTNTKQNAQGNAQPGNQESKPVADDTIPW